VAVLFRSFGVSAHKTFIFLVFQSLNFERT